jgi:hypothetical protein
MLTLAFNIQPAETEFSPLTAREESAAMQGTINLASQEPPPTEWNKTYGGAEWEDAKALVQTVDGGYALAGWTTSFGAGNADFWLVKTDASGTEQWNKTYGGTTYDSAYALVQTADGGYALAGDTDSIGAGSWDFWLVKTDSAGTMMWNKTYGGTEWDEAHALVQTNDGGYALAGWTRSFGAGSSDSWLVKTDVNGNEQWNKTYGETSSDFAQAIVQTSDGGYAIAGGTASFGAGDIDFWLVKTDAIGTVQWNKTYGTIAGEWAYALVQTGDGGYALAGATGSFGVYNWDFWLVKTDASGNTQWSKNYGGTKDEEAYALVAAGDGGYALAGYTDSIGAGERDFWLVKTDVHGTYEWSKTYGGTEWEVADTLVETSDGGYALAGLTWSFGAGERDFWLVKTEPWGDVVPPEVGLPMQEPSANTKPDQNVTVRVNVTDFDGGVYNVTLWYSIDNGTTWIPQNMTEFIPDIYQAAIPGQLADTRVRYKIIAYDKAGNYRVEDKDGEYYVYTVIPEFTPTISLLFMIATLLVVIAYSSCRRKSPARVKLVKIFLHCRTSSLAKGRQKVKFVKKVRSVKFP